MCGALLRASALCERVS